MAVSKLTDPKRLMEALGELDRAIAGSSAAGDHIIRQSEGQQLALHVRHWLPVPPVTATHQCTCPMTGNDGVQCARTMYHNSFFDLLLRV